VAAAARLLAARQRRSAVFGPVADSFGEPSWDMLLHLFVAGDAGVRPVRADELFQAGGVTGNQARMFLDFLAVHRMVRIDGDDERALVTLADAGRGLMAEYFTAEMAA